MKLMYMCTTISLYSFFCLKCHLFFSFFVFLSPPLFPHYDSYHHVWGTANNRWIKSQSRGGQHSPWAAHDHHVGGQFRVWELGVHCCVSLFVELRLGGNWVSGGSVFVILQLLECFLHWLCHLHFCFLLFLLLTLLLSSSFLCLFVSLSRPTLLSSLLSLLSALFSFALSLSSVCSVLFLSLPPSLFPSSFRKLSCTLALVSFLPTK